MRSRFHPFYWMIADGDKSRRDWPFQVRDALALRQISAALRGFGYEDGRDLLNFPPPDRDSTAPLAHIDTSWSRLSDLLLTFTRIPRSDLAQGARKKLSCGRTDLGAEVMEEWSPYAPSISRLLVQVHDRLIPLLKKGYENRARMKLREEALAPYHRLSRCDGRPASKYAGPEIRTPVFLLRVPRMQHRRMGYLGIWGPDGNTTLIWATLLRFRHPELLEQNHFVMADLVGRSIPERPFDLDFAADWRAELVIREPIRRGGKRSGRASVPVGANLA